MKLEGSVKFETAKRANHYPAVDVRGQILGYIDINAPCLRGGGKSTFPTNLNPKNIPKRKDLMVQNEHISKRFLKGGKMLSNEFLPFFELQKWWLVCAAARFLAAFSLQGHTQR